MKQRKGKDGLNPTSLKMAGGLTPLTLDLKLKQEIETCQQFQ